MSLVPPVSHLAGFALALIFLLCPAPARAASPSSALLKAKQEADAKALVFEVSRDAIVAKAKKEGKLRVLTGLETSNKFTADAFRKKYPFIDLHVENIRGTEQGQRNLLEVKSGASKDWDTVRTFTDFYTEYLPHLWKVDLLGMAEQGVLAIPPAMIDPRNRHVLGLVSRFQVSAYNKSLLPTAQAPKTWQDILKPAFKGKKFAVDIRPQEIAALVPAWGLEKTLDFSRKVAAQQPIWVRGGSRTLQAVLSGEVPLFIGPNYDSVREFQRKDPLGVLQFVVMEPVPVRVSSEQGILASAKNPYAALLWFEHMASSEAQKLIDQHEPLAASLYVRGSIAEQEMRGKRLSVVSWEHYQSVEQWMSKIVEAYGFPKAEAIGKR
jgi:iron(III) transport system substrate-binding protein